jgi:drug/metabolite transporter (DMT)-like permease
MHSKALLALLFTTLIWGVTGVFVRAFTLAAGPVDALIIRTSAVMIVFFLVLLPRANFWIAAKDWPRLMFVSLAGVGGYFVFTVFGFVHAPSGIGMLIMSTQPLIIALFARLAGTEKLTVTTVLGLLVSFAGSVLLVSGEDMGTATSSSADVIFGCALIFIAGVAWAIFVVFSKPLIVEYGALKITALSNILITPPILILAFVPQLGADPVATLLSLENDAIVSLAFLTFLGATLSVVTWNYAAATLKPSLLGASLYVVPILGILAGWIMLAEPLTSHIIIAAAVILAGVAIAQVKFGNGSTPAYAIGLVLFAVTMWGMVPVAMRYLLLDVSPQTAMVLRLLPAGILAATIVIFLRIPRLTSKDWMRIVAAAVFGNVAYQVLAAFGGQLIPASWTGMLFGLEPVFIALGAAIFAGERLSGWFLTGLLIALAGTGVLMLGGSSGTVKDVSILGIILVALSTVGWAVYTITIRPVSAKCGAFATACLALSVSAFPMLVFASPQLIAETQQLTAMHWGAVAFLAVFATVLSTGAWNMALGHMDSSMAGMFLYVQPIVAALGGIFLLGEEVSPWLLGGGALIFLGVTFSQVRKPGALLENDAETYLEDEAALHQNRLSDP